MSPGGVGVMSGIHGTGKVPKVSLLLWWLLKVVVLERTVAMNKFANNFCADRLVASLVDAGMV
jgi:hypothetical protein